jgi:uncharacterized protein YndB with AHSA1/START domain
MAKNRNVTLEKIEARQGGRVLRLEYFLNHSAKDVWAALTRPDRLAQWFAKPDAKPAKGAQVVLKFQNTGHVVTTRVTRIEENKLLEYVWESQQLAKKLPKPLRAANGTCGQPLLNTKVLWQVLPATKGSLLRLTHTLGPQIKAKGGVEPGVVLASWQTHLDGLTAALGRKFKAAGSKGRFEVNRWANLRDQYTKSIQ